MTKDLVVIAETYPTFKEQTLDEEETCFWANPESAEQNHFAEFVHQPGYAENVKLNSGPLIFAIEHLSIGGGGLPEEQKKLVNERMSKWYLQAATFLLPGRDIQIRLICNISKRKLQDLGSKLADDDLQNLTKDAAVYNVRFQLGRQFTPDAFIEGLENFLRWASAKGAKTVKIAFWDDDIKRNSFPGSDYARIADDIASFGLRIADGVMSNFEVVALENRVIGENERERQEGIHASSATAEELENLQKLISGVNSPL